MSTLSFVPRYHELVVRDGQAIWSPIYNPNREDVAAERRCLQAEGAAVETNSQVFDAKTRRVRERDKRVNSASGRLFRVALPEMLVLAAAFVALAYVVGSAVLKWLCPEWLALLSAPEMTLASISSGVLLLSPLGDWILRRAGITPLS